VTDGAQLLEAVRRLRPDVVVTDMVMPGLSGLDALRRLKADGLASRVVVLTMHADATLAAEALRAGASGFVVKSVAGSELVAAIQAVLRGKTYLSPQLAQDVLADLAEGKPPGGAKLTVRQREVLRLIVDGKTMKEVATILGLSPRTVETHKYQVMEALGLGTTAELVRYAVEHGLATPPPDPPRNR
jgi:DNA-binding NarL/FixJ family response regulator